MSFTNKLKKRFTFKDLDDFLAKSKEMVEDAMKIREFAVKTARRMNAMAKESDSEALRDLRKKFHGTDVYKFMKEAAVISDAVSDLADEITESSKPTENRVTNLPIAPVGPLKGGRKKRKTKKRKTTNKTKKHKVHKGPRGGKYIMKKGKKVYV